MSPFRLPRKDVAIASDRDRWSEADTVADAGHETGDRALLLAAIRKLPMADQQLVMLYLEGLRL